MKINRILTTVIAAYLGTGLSWFLLTSFSKGSVPPAEEMPEHAREAFLVIPVG